MNLRIWLVDVEGASGYAVENGDDDIVVQTVGMHNTWKKILG